MRRERSWSRNQSVALFGEWFHNSNEQPFGCLKDRFHDTRSETNMSTASDTDRIERSVVIDAPRERVWRALSNAEEFGTWFGANLKGQTFAPGQRVRGQITHPGYEHLYFDVVIERTSRRASSRTAGIRIPSNRPWTTRRSSRRS
jgi:hypothetical protein